ncbi:hypothetical protein A4A49_00840 [Nicotiana attenuata]|uniref:Uncharacterized protein n=1 Tax=Nicotiana attenuata TaxID=49451 RepID=A0A1J6IFM6_NICAT|nr:hypothetical protein A4A49_00840 [Nicotiana attenuata]
MVKGVGGWWDGRWCCVLGFSSGRRRRLGRGGGVSRVQGLAGYGWSAAEGWRCDCCCLSRVRYLFWLKLVKVIVGLVVKRCAWSWWTAWRGAGGCSRLRVEKARSYRRFILRFCSVSFALFSRPFSSSLFSCVCVCV